MRVVEILHETEECTNILRCRPSRAGRTAETVEDEEQLQARAIVRQTADFVLDGVIQLLVHNVVTTATI